MTSIPESFENVKLSMITWVPGNCIITDAHTKDNLVSCAHLYKTFCNGIYPPHPDSITSKSPMLDRNPTISN